MSVGMFVFAKLYHIRLIIDFPDLRIYRRLRIYLNFYFTHLVSYHDYVSVQRVTRLFVEIRNEKKQQFYSQFL